MKMESIGNKKGVLKTILIQLHQGASIDEVKDQAKKIMKELTSEDIAAVEQELIKEGIPRESIQKLCDIHIEIFKETLDNKAIDYPHWHPLYILTQEHNTLLPMAEKLTTATDPEEIAHTLHHLKEPTKHYHREENILFPSMEKQGITEPPAIMWSEHDKIREMEKTMYDLYDQKNYEALKEKACVFYEFLSSHFYKENNVLYPTAFKIISEDEFKDIRAQFDEIGYCCFTPQIDNMQPKVKPVQKTQKTGDAIHFESGEFTVDELQTMLDTLPIDITFVGKDDTVRYFSQSPDRIFVRTKAIIGRTVQNCHPSKSVEIVNNIVTAFKEGTKDKAEFWLELNGRLIYIRYFAVRKNGEYIGTVEVSQDITDIKKIEGQHTLLDWE